MIELARAWMEKGRYKYKGLTWVRGINDYSGSKELGKLVTLRLTDLAHHFDELMIPSPCIGGTPAKGFIIGRGTAIYWYITPMPSGLYKCYRQFDNGEIGSPRYIEPTTIVSVLYQ